MARYSSIKSVISIAVEMGWSIHQIDVKTTFLNGVFGSGVPSWGAFSFVAAEMVSLLL